MPDSEQGTDDMNPRDGALMDSGSASDASEQDAASPENSAPGHVLNKWRVIPYGSVEATYDDNIFITAQNPQPDEYVTLATGIAAGWGAVQRNLGETTSYFRQADTPKVETNQQEEGNYLFGNYSVSEELFAHNTSQNAFNQDASFAGEWRFEKFLFGASIHYQTLSDIDIDIGGRVKRDLLTANATANYYISDKTNAEVDFNSTSNFYPSALDSTDTSVQAWMNYEPTGKITGGLGVKVGDLAVQGSPSQIYEAILLRGVYAATGKLTFTATAGLEARQLDGSAHFDPVFTLGATYAASDQTTIYLDGFRQTFSSASTAGEDIATTAISLRVRQRLFEKVYLSVAGGYQRGQYEEVIDTFLPNRADDSFDFRAGVSFDFTQWATLELSYEYRYNRSTEADKEFKQHLTTLQMDLFF